MQKFANSRRPGSKYLFCLPPNVHFKAFLQRCLCCNKNLLERKKKFDQERQAKQTAAAKDSVECFFLIWETKKSHFFIFPSSLWRFFSNRKILQKKLQIIESDHWQHFAMKTKRSVRFTPTSYHLTFEQKRQYLLMHACMWNVGSLDRTDEFSTGKSDCTSN
jgi:hypothetical protein